MGCFGRNFGPCINTSFFIPYITSIFLCCNSSFFIPCIISFFLSCISSLFIPCIISFFLSCISSFFIPCITSFFLCCISSFFIPCIISFFLCCTSSFFHHKCTTSYNKQCINHLCFILSFAGTSSPQILILQFSVFIDFNIVCMFEYSYKSLYDKTLK